MGEGMPSPTHLQGARHPRTPCGTGIHGGGTAFMQTGQSTVYLTSIHGISAEELTCVAKELGVIQSALATFCEILEQQQVPPEDLDSTLREIAKNYNTMAIVPRTPTYYSKMT